MDIYNPTIKRNISLKELNTFQIGGKAKYFSVVKNKEDLIGALSWAKDKKIKYYILGGGSNILVPDQGIDGLVLHLRNNNRNLQGQKIKCGAGATLSQVNTLATAHHLSGLEWSVGIPRATIGGSIRGNAEAFGVSMSQLVEQVEVYDEKNEKFVVLNNKKCDFAYRNSLFKKVNNLIVWQANLQFISADSAEIQAKIKQAIDFRTNNFLQLPSAGSMFANISQTEMEKANWKILRKELVGKINREGNVGAGALIDIAGLKGKTIGGIKISLEHANHIVNTGQGTAEQVIMMISFIKQQIRNKFNIELREEIQYFGF